MKTSTNRSQNIIVIIITAVIVGILLVISLPTYQQSHKAATERAAQVGVEKIVSVSALSATGVQDADINEAVSALSEKFNIEIRTDAAGTATVTATDKGATGVSATAVFVAR